MIVIDMTIKYKTMNDGGIQKIIIKKMSDGSTETSYEDWPNYVGLPSLSRISNLVKSIFFV